MKIYTLMIEDARYGEPTTVVFLFSNISKALSWARNTYNELDWAEADGSLTSLLPVRVPVPDSDEEIVFMCEYKEVA